MTSTAGTKYHRSIDDALTSIILARFGSAAEFTVTQYQERSCGLPELMTWYALSIRRVQLDDWHIVGRRRTRGELVELARSCPF